MDWWVWLLIALGIALVVGLVIFLVIRATKKSVESVTVATTTTPAPGETLSN
uniref:Uncharacterized protein n=1 Tax=viral metagenome TaxID=1070528 RepID=A0A6C0IXE5_9ZZZZ